MEQAYKIVVDTRLVEKVGYNESVVLSQIHYWVQLNKSQGKNYYDGRYWTYNSFEGWHKHFFWWSISTIKRIFSELEKNGYLVVGCYNKNGVDRTKWYSINYDKLPELKADDSGDAAPLCQNDTMPLCQNDTMQSVNLTRPIPKNNCREYTENKEEIRSKVLSENLQERDVEAPPKFPVVSKEGKITESQAKKLFGASALADALALVNDYIDVQYPKYQGRIHPAVSKRSRIIYASRLLTCSATMYQNDLGLVADALMAAVKNEKNYDPTIFLETRPKTLGIWMTESGELPYDLVRGTNYDFAVEGEPAMRVDTEQAEAFRREYVSYSPLTSEGG